MSALVRRPQFPHQDLELSVGEKGKNIRIVTGCCRADSRSRLSHGTVSILLTHILVVRGCISEFVTMEKTSPNLALSRTQSPPEEEDKENRSLP